jgi:hypothetical protein
MTGIEAAAPPARRWSDWAWPAVWAVLEAACFLAPVPAGADEPGDAYTRNTARLMVLLYGAAAAWMLCLRGDDWRAAAGRSRAARWLWTLGWAAYVVHVVTAFHFAHHWSHAQAVGHVRAASGWREGIYFSHLFTLIWTADVLWWWARPAGYSARPRWVGWLLHGFMAFMVFNATVVFEAGPVRWAGAVLFLGLGVLLARRLFLASARGSGIPPESQAAPPPAGRRSPS